MYYLALACDYDGTLAKDGVVSSKTIDALERVGASGRKLILVTGRLLEDLQQVFPRLDLFTYVVAENGALLYHPASSTEQVLGEAPPRQFLQALQERGVPLSTGRVIVATWHPHETTVVEVIGKLGLERQVIKDPDLAAEAETVEKDEKLSASESRARIVEAIEQRYTLPA